MVYKGCCLPLSAIANKTYHFRAIAHPIDQDCEWKSLLNIVEFSRGRAAKLQFFLTWTDGRMT